MEYNINDFGAVGDGNILCTKSIQSAIDTCAERGGGRIIVPQGNYLTGTIYLKNGCELYLESGSSLVGSTNINDYRVLPGSDYWYSVFTYGIYGLVLADGVENAGITGNGTIDGKGKNKDNHFPNAGDVQKRRPFLVVFRDCRDMYIENIRMKDPAIFSFYGIHSDGIRIRGVDVKSRDCTNGDGLDFDGTRNVRISDCVFDTGDDSISLKTLDPEYPCENYVITNCIMKSRWAAIRFGTESSADMRNCTVSNCVFEECEDGLKIQTNSGGIYEDFCFNNLVMRNVKRPILMTLTYFRFGKKDAGIRPTGSLIRRVTIDTISVFMPEKYSNNQSYFVFSGMPGKHIRDISLSNLNVVFQGGGSVKDAERILVPETLDYTEYYFEARYFRGNLPASGIFLRHIDNLRISNCVFQVINDDQRPVVFAYDINNFMLSGVSGIGKAARLIKTSLCENLIMNYCYFNGAECAAAETRDSKTDSMLLEHTKTAEKVEINMAEWAAVTDEAQKGGCYRKLCPEDFHIHEEKNKTFFTVSIDFSQINGREKIWLFFPAFRGNMVVYAADRKIAEHIMPYENQTWYTWAVEIGSYISERSIELKIEAEMGMPDTINFPAQLCRRANDGFVYGMLELPEIGIDDKKTFSEELSSSPDIFAMGQYSGL